MDDRSRRALYIVRTRVPEERVEEWYRWHSEVHIPDVAAQPGVVRATKYRVVEDNMPAEWTAQYVTVYEFETLEAFEAYRAGDEAARLRSDHAEHYGADGKIARQVLVEEVSVPGSSVR
jgi:heme-degrading monooxygenase HmoA